MWCRAAATPAAAASPAGCSSARAGKPTRTPTSISRSRATPGSRSARRSASPNGSTDPAYTTAKARQPHIEEIFATIEKWLADKTKFEAVDILRKFDIPCSPVLTMKELANDPSLRASGTIVEVDHKNAASI